MLQSVRELVANAVKHAQASQLQVSAALCDGRIETRVQDDCQGFELA